MMSLDTVSWTARSIIADFMASTVILKRYRDGVYVGTFWEKYRDGKGLNVLKHTAILFKGKRHNKNAQTVFMIKIKQFL
jgi:hypothetical protein